MSRNKWGVLAAVTVVQIFTFGPAVAPLGVFFTPLIKQFGWSHAQVAQMATALNISLGACALLAGWMLDRVDARWVMGIGAAIGGCAILLASRANSLETLLGCYALAGVGVALCGPVAMAVVAVGCLPRRPALAMGIAQFGMTLGMALSPRIIGAVVTHAGWRDGMAAIGLPLLLIALPVCLLFISTRPAAALQAGEVPAEAQSELAGLEVRQALATIPMWLLVALSFVFQFGLGAAFYHTVPFLLHVGYPLATATTAFGVGLFTFGPGGLIWGVVTDKIGSKPVIFTGFTLMALSVVSLSLASLPSLGMGPVIGYMVLWGTACAAAVALPVMLVETLGKRRYGTLYGILGFAGAMGQASGPLVAGWLIDINKGYTMALEMAALSIFVGAVLGAIVYPARGADEVASPVALSGASRSVSAL